MSGNDDKNSKKMEMKIQRDLKELIDRNGSIFGSSKVEQEKNKNPLKNFFIDEMNLTKKTLNLIRVDMESARFEDTKVKYKLNLLLSSNYLKYFFINKLSSPQNYYKSNNKIDQIYILWSFISDFILIIIIIYFKSGSEVSFAVS